VSSFNIYASKGVLAVEMHAASLFAFAEARRASVGLVVHVTNAINHHGDPSTKDPKTSAFARSKQFAARDCGC